MSKDLREKMNIPLQKMKTILTNAGKVNSIKPPDTDGMKDQLASDTQNRSMADMDTYIKQLDSLVDELLKLVEGMQKGDKKSQSSGTSFGHFLSSVFSSSAKVQMFMPIPTSSAATISKLCKALNYNCDTISRVTELRTTLPLLVICPVSSRFETDIDYALDGLKWSSVFLTLLLHSGTESSLPTLPTATRLPDKEKYRNAEFIDIALTPDSQLYQCMMNEDAKQKIKVFVDKYYDR